MVEQRNVAVPDLGGEPVAVLADLTETLIARVGDTPTSPLPAVLADGFGLEPLDRISAVPPPTQEAAGPRRLSPDRRPEHRRLSLVGLDPAELSAVGAAVRALGREPLPDAPANTEVRTTLAASPLATEGAAPAAVVAGDARLPGPLDLAGTTDATAGRDHLRTAGPGAREIGLAAPTEAACLRLAARVAARGPAAGLGPGRGDG